LEENSAAAQIKLSRAELYEVRKLVDSAEIVGGRYFPNNHRLIPVKVS
jgi:hypothetical protein